MNDNLRTVTDLQQSVGQTLKTTREAKNLSIDKVAQNLLLSKTVIMALEEDDYSKIPAQVYAEGYLKAYAQFLQISPHNILANFRRLHVYPTVDEQRKSESRREIPVNRVQGVLGVIKKRRVNPVLLGLLALAIGGVLLFYAGKQIVEKKQQRGAPVNTITEKVGEDLTINREPVENTTSAAPMVPPHGTPGADEALEYREPKIILSKPKKVRENPGK